MAQKDGIVVQQTGEHKVFPPLDPSTFAPQLIWLAIAFGLLYVLLRRVILPRVGEIVEERSDRMKRDIAQAEKLKNDTATALANYEQSLTHARTKASEMAKTIRDKITAEFDQERIKGEAEIAAKLAEAEKRIAEAKSKALMGVADLASDLAVAIVTRFLGEEVSKDEVARALMRQAAE